MHTPEQELLLRLATPRDAAACLAIYAPIVRDTAISFELVPPTEQEFAARIEKTLERHPWLVATGTNGIAGYAYATEFRARPAYRFTAETSVYVGADARGRGVARRLYECLLLGLERAGFCEAIGGIVLPNPASVALHEKLGFQFVGEFARVGFKHGAWHSVGFWQRPLARSVPPRDPLPPGALGRRAPWSIKQSSTET